MSLFEDNPKRIEPDQAPVLSHPVRINILALFTRDTDRSLTGPDLLADLVADDTHAFGGYDVGQILYHRARLQDARLLPT